MWTFYYFEKTHKMMLFTDIQSSVGTYMYSMSSMKNLYFNSKFQLGIFKSESRFVYLGTL